MEIPLLEPDETPLPPEAVRFRSVTAEPYPDGRRVRFKVELTPFLERPSLEIAVRNSNGDEVSSISIVENMDRAFTLTAHLRGRVVAGRHTVRLALVYPDRDPVDIAEASFEVPESS